MIRAREVGNDPPRTLPHSRTGTRAPADHPTEDRFGPFGFVTELENTGLHVGNRAITRFFCDFVIGVADLV